MSNIIRNALYSPATIYTFYRFFAYFLALTTTVAIFFLASFG